MKIGLSSQEPLGQPVIRRHDLDALRGFAMLLGIGLHAAIAYLPVSFDNEPNQSGVFFALFIAAIHGFRMPLFILLSGYFTAMLLHKRGLKSLLIHRCKRLLLPCLLAVFTITPLVIGISIATDKARNAKTSIWNAASKGNINQLEHLLSNGFSIDAQRPKTGITPLILAVSRGQNDAVRYLLKNGAQVDRQANDESSPLHFAALYGRSEIARRLIENGAEPHIRRDDGITPLDLTQYKWKATQRLANWAKVSIKKKEVLDGRIRIAAMLGEAPNESKSFIERYRGLTRIELFNLPLFSHMWFIWYLCWLTAIFAGIILAARLFRIKQLHNWKLLLQKYCLCLIPLTLIPQVLMVSPGSFGPDTSSSLLPMPHILLYYGIFFAFGALNYQDSSDKFVRGCWKVCLPTALFLMFPLGIILGFKNVETGLESEFIACLGLLISTSYTWLMIFGCIGLFKKLLDRPIPWVRYLSDSSYWLYLSHLPLVMCMQFIIADWPVSPFLKFGLICIVSTGFLLLSYEHLVRYRWLGKFLNGSRKKRVPLL